MQNAIIEKLTKSQARKHPNFRVGDKINVFVRLKEGDKERVQAFRGVCITKHPKTGNGAGATFTVRKVSEGVGVERIFPFHSPFIEKIEIESSAKVRRSRLYYLRALKGRKARLKTSDRFAELVAEPKKVAADQVVTAEEGAAKAETSEETPKKK